MISSKSAITKADKDDSLFAHFTSLETLAHKEWDPKSDECIQKLYEYPDVVFASTALVSTENFDDSEVKTDPSCNVTLEHHIGTGTLVPLSLVEKDITYLYYILFNAFKLSVLDHRISSKPVTVIKLYAGKLSPLKDRLFDLLKSTYIASLHKYRNLENNDFYTFIKKIAFAEETAESMPLTSCVSLEMVSKNLSFISTQLKWVDRPIVSSVSRIATSLSLLNLGLLIDHIQLFNENFLVLTRNNSNKKTEQKLLDLYAKYMKTVLRGLVSHKVCQIVGEDFEYCSVYSSHVFDVFGSIRKEPFKIPATWLGMHNSSPSVLSVVQNTDAAELNNYLNPDTLDKQLFPRLDPKDVLWSD